MDNETIAKSIYEYADLLEASAQNPYRVRAYRRAARSILKINQSISKLVLANESLQVFPYIGSGIEKFIIDLVRYNKFPEIKLGKVSIKANELKDIESLSNSNIKQLNKIFNIYTKKDLLSSLDSNLLSQLKWLSPNLIKKIRAELNQANVKSRRFLRLHHAVPVVNAILKQLTETPGVKRADCAGAFRRKVELIEEKLIFVVSTTQFRSVSENILSFSGISDLIEKYPRKITVLLHVGLKAQFILVSDVNYDMTLFEHTGTIEHNEIIINLLHEKKLTVDNKKIKHLSEELLYKTLNLDFIPPVLRENRGEIEAAKKHKLPKLVTLCDIKGNLHTHTNETDGQETLETMAEAAYKLGYEYLAITDHSKRLAITNGLDEVRLLKQIELINKFNESQKKILLLKSIEVDILLDGSLDLSNDVLKELDIVVASIHSFFRQPEQKQTERIIRAMDNPYFNILGHATGRLIKSRKPYEITLEKILYALKERNCFIELNAQPYRLDINDIYCKMAKDIGVKVAISSDAHSIRELGYMPYGIYQAQRGWLESKDVLNTYSWIELKKIIKR